jgi:anti-sigma B factor antagonist
MSEENKFSIQHQSMGNIECLFLEGYLDAHTAPELENRLSGLIDTGKNNILVSFKDLDYISSAGLGVFMAFIEDVRQSGGDIKMSDMKPKVFSVFDLLGFPLLFDIVKDTGSALTKFESGVFKPEGVDE